MSNSGYTSERDRLKLETFAAWWRLTKAEQSGRVPVDELEHLYDLYLQAVTAQMLATTRGLRSDVRQLRLGMEGEASA